MLMKIDEPMSGPADQPSWQAFLELGFRPLYLAGASWAAIAIALWIFAPQWLMGDMQGVTWHAHEMLWGFVVTIAVGFLMTAGANWTGINPMPPRALAIACSLWLAARVAYLFPGLTALWVGAAAESLFLLIAAFGMLIAVITSKNRRNLGVPFVLLALCLAHLAFIASVASQHTASAMQAFHAGLLLMAMLVLLIGRRVIPFFAMRAIPGLDIPKHTRSGQLQLILTVIAIMAMLAEQNLLAAAALAMVGGMSMWQVFQWKPMAVAHKPILWVLYLGYAICGIGLMAAAARYVEFTQRAAWSVHTIAIGGFGVLIMGMITRTALGHLGRALELSKSMVTCYWLVLIAAGFRLAALIPSGMTVLLLNTSALAWIAAFAIYVREFAPMMVRMRPAPVATRTAPLPQKQR